MTSETRADDVDRSRPRMCPDGYYRGCDFMGCVGLLRSCKTWPVCPYRMADR